MKKKTPKQRRRKDSPTGREVIESLTEPAVVLESGRSDFRHFKHHTVKRSEKIRAQQARTDYLEGVNADYAALKKNRQAFADFKREMEAWDGTNLDGLADDD